MDSMGGSLDGPQHKAPRVGGVGGKETCPLAPAPPSQEAVGNSHLRSLPVCSDLASWNGELH